MILQILKPKMLIKNIMIIIWILYKVIYHKLILIIINYQIIMMLSMHLMNLMIKKIYLLNNMKNQSL